METNELKKIWQTLSNENLIDKRIAKENIEGLIKQKSSKTVERLSKKLSFDYLINIAAAILVLAITVFAAFYLNHRSHTLPVRLSKNPSKIFLKYVLNICVFCRLLLPLGYEIHHRTKQKSACTFSYIFR